MVDLNDLESRQLPAKAGSPRMLSNGFAISSSFPLSRSPISCATLPSFVVTGTSCAVAPTERRNFVLFSLVTLTHQLRNITQLRGNWHFLRRGTNRARGVENTPLIGFVFRFGRLVRVVCRARIPRRFVVPGTPRVSALPSRSVGAFSLHSGGSCPYHLRARATCSRNVHWIGHLRCWSGRRSETGVMLCGL